MRRSCWVVVVCLIFSSCRKEDKYQDVYLFGHAGDGLDVDSSPYPENTLDGVDYAFSYPEVTGVEVDIQWSKDGTAWVFHDDDLSRQTGESGCVREMTDEQLLSVRYKGFQHQNLPQLTDVAPLLTGKKVVLDIKKPYNCGESLTNAEFENSLLAFNSLLTETEVFVIVQDLTNIAFIQGLGWHFILNVSSTADYKNTVNWELTDGCSIRNQDVSASEVAELKAMDKEVIIFDARSPAKIRKALKKHPVIFLADDIKATLIEKIR